MKLKELQSQFAECIRVPLTPKERMRKKDRKGRSLERVAKNIIKPNDRLSSFERLEIYNRQYWFRILSCFYEDFPGLRTVMGDKKFEAMAAVYLDKNRSRSFTLRDLGGRLVPWLQKNKRWIQPNADLALDMARLEWAHVEAFDRAELPRLTADDALDSNPARLRFYIQPYVQLLALRYPVDDLLIETKHGGSGNNIASNAFTGLMDRKGRVRSKKLKKQPVWLAVHRLDFQVYYKPLTREAFLMLEALARGKSFEQAVRLGFTKSAVPLPQRPGLIQQWFTEWSALGWFCKKM